ncbi:MAG: hypothetical protein CMH81_02065 [Nitrospiraceae bacterium]|nr:hypothetical protein [Nitrospiraceae bacterium]
MRRTLLVHIVLLGLFLFLWAEVASAVPRFSMRTGLSCNACHVNPSGGGMRTEHGSLYGRMNLPLNPTMRAKGEKFSPKITKHLTVGSDLRVMGFSDNRHNLSFFPMQADLYISAQLTDKVLLYHDQSLLSSEIETFGLAQILPFSGYVKAGKFVPAFGWKHDNHTAFTRGGNSSSREVGQVTRGTGFSRDDKDTGVEVGFYPGQASIQLAVLNGQRGGIPFDNNQGKAYVARADYFILNFEHLKTNVGGSFYHNDAETFERQIYAGHAGINLWKLTYLGEYDWNELSRDTTPRVKSTAQYHELSFLPVQGIDLKGIYEHIDPDRNIDRDELSRIGAGIEFFPLPHNEIRLEYRHTTGHKEINPDAGLDEVFLMYHFYF